MMGALGSVFLGVRVWETGALADYCSHVYVIGMVLRSRFYRWRQ